MIIYIMGRKNEKLQPCVVMTGGLRRLLSLLLLLVSRLYQMYRLYEYVIKNFQTKFIKTVRFVTIVIFIRCQQRKEKKLVLD